MTAGENIDTKKRYDRVVGYKLKPTSMKQEIWYTAGLMAMVMLLMGVVHVAITLGRVIVSL